MVYNVTHVQQVVFLNLVNLIVEAVHQARNHHQHKTLAFFVIKHNTLLMDYIADNAQIIRLHQAKELQVVKFVVLDQWQIHGKMVVLIVHLVTFRGKEKFVNHAHLIPIQSKQVHLNAYSVVLVLK